jgi:hypothetical protein
MQLKNQDTVMALKIGVVYLEAKNKIINEYTQQQSKPLKASLAINKITDISDALAAAEVIKHINFTLSYRELGREIGISQTEVGRSIKRLKAAKLLSATSAMDIPFLINIRGLEEWTSVAMQYANKPIPKSIGMGLPTAWSNPLLASQMVARDIPHVWDGLSNLAAESSNSPQAVQGEIISGLYKGVSLAAAKSIEMYKLLSILDAFRIAKPRELKIAKEIFHNYMENLDAAQQFFN